MITRCIQKIEYRGHFLAETIRRVDTDSEVARQSRWEISYVDAYGVEIPAGKALNLAEAKQKVDARLLTK